MKTFKLISILLTLFISYNLSSYAQAPKQFSFDNGRFKILQFTDLHWLPKSDGCVKTEKTMVDLIQKEHPNLVIITGDIITGKPAKEGWQSLCRIMEQQKQAFAVTLGNHDTEYILGDSIFQLLAKCPYFVSGIQAKDISGSGNAVIPIYGRGHKIKSALYLIDSHAYLPPNTYGHYDWIHNDQIQWFRKTTKSYVDDQGKAVPSLMFFHIPIPEYNAILPNDKHFGIFKDDGVNSPTVNSGLFASLLSCGNVMGTFVGHDHNSDFIGLHYGKALGYGRATGEDAYGDLEDGGRCIVLYEGIPCFDTWITTPKQSLPKFYYPSGINQAQENNMSYLPSVPVNGTKNGVAYQYYEGQIKSVKDIDKCILINNGTEQDFSLAPAKVEDHFAFIFDTYVKIPERGVYGFYTFSDDGSQLYVDNQLVVDNDGGHSARRRYGMVALEKGMHKLQVRYFENYMGQTLEVGIWSRSLPLGILPTNWLFLPTKD